MGLNGRSYVEKMVETEIKERHWYAIYTRPRFENILVKQLQVIGITSFLPTKKVSHIWSDRKKLIIEPLFPCYVFVYANCKERLLSVQSRGGVCVVSFAGQPARIPEIAIESVRRVVSSEFPTENVPYLVRGDEVEIIAGPLCGLKGLIDQRRGPSHFIISIHKICKSYAVHVDARILRRVAGSHQTREPSWSFTR
jgi:transcription antitermination factor NusG